MFLACRNVDFHRLLVAVGVMVEIAILVCEDAFYSFQHNGAAIKKDRAKGNRQRERECVWACFNSEHLHIYKIPNGNECAFCDSKEKKRKTFNDDLHCIPANVSTQSMHSNMILIRHLVCHCHCQWRWWSYVWMKSLTFWQNTIGNYMDLQNSIAPGIVLFLSSNVFGGGGGNGWTRLIWNRKYTLHEILHVDHW